MGRAATQCEFIFGVGSSLPYAALHQLTLPVRVLISQVLRNVLQWTHMPQGIPERGPSRVLREYATRRAAFPTHFSNSPDIVGIAQGILLLCQSPFLPGCSETMDGPLIASSAFYATRHCGEHLARSSRQVTSRSVAHKGQSGDHRLPHSGH